MNNNYRVRRRVMNIAVEPVHEAYRRSRRSRSLKTNDGIVWLAIAEIAGVASSHIRRFGWGPNAAGRRSQRAE